MELIILGSGSCIPYKRRRSSAYAVRAGDINLMLDMGSGSTWRLAQHGINHTEVHSVLISHFHPDHTADLIPFLFGTRWTVELPRKSPLYIFTPEGFQRIFDKLMNIYGRWVQPDHYGLTLKEIPVNEHYMFYLDNFEVQTCPTAHTESSIAYKLTSSDGSTLVYTGDTDYCESVVHLSRNADVLLAECSFPDELERTGHLTPAKAGRIAEKAQVSKLVLTHFYPECDRVDVVAQCMEEYSGEIVIAEDNMTIKI